VLCDTARGLAYMHENGRAHRDVKPDNILVRQLRNPPPSGPTVCAVLADLALAIGMSSSQSSLSPAGTKLFMDEESLADGAPNPLQDVFALGVTAALVLLRHTPAAGDQPTARGLVEDAKQRHAYLAPLLCLAHSSAKWILQTFPLTSRSCQSRLHPCFSTQRLRT